MTPTRRHLLALACATTLGLPFTAAAQAFPTRPVTLIVPFATGGPTDAMARTLANALKDQLGQPVIVDNKAGAGGNLGAETVARAEPDGHTVLFGTSGPLAINVSLFRKIGYDPVKSFAPVIRIGHLPNVLVVNPNVPAKTVGELIAHGKAHPGKLSYASSGNGASSHLAGVLFNNLAGTDFVHVPYRGTGPALTDLLGGQVAMTFTDVLTAAPHVKAGKLRALGVTTLERSQALPEVPTVDSQGLKGYDVSVFFGIVAPAGTPKAAVDRLNQAFVAALKQPDVRQTLSAQGLEFAADTSPQHLATFIAAEVAKWRAVVQSSGAQID
jgi:tripartite-type tricarboxylate transporter receptor subunit TctC